MNKLIVLLMMYFVVAASVTGQRLQDQVVELIGSLEFQYSNHPGVIVSVIHKDETFTEHTGLSNLEYELPISGKSMFDIASLSKQFTGYCIAKLELEGQLSSDDFLIRYFPQLHSSFSAIQLKHLIYHSSGIRDIGELFDVGHYGTDLTAEKTIEIIVKQRGLNFEPGSAYSYSNTNYVLLALIVEQVSNLSFTEYCRKYIFDQFEMKSSMVNDCPKSLITNRAIAYYQDEQGYTYNQNNGMSLIGSSAMFSTSEDLTQWCIAFLKGSSSDAIFQKMIQPPGPDTGDSFYGYGIASEYQFGQHLLVHSGSTPAGFRSAIVMIPDQDFAIVALSNYGNIDLQGQLIQPILFSLFGSDVAPQVSEVTEVNSDSYDMSSTQMEAFVGEYLFNGERKVQIRLDKNGLTVQPEGAPQMMLTPISEGVLDIPDFRSQLHFDKLVDGKYAIATIRQGEQVAGNLERVQFVEEYDSKTSYAGLFHSKELGLYWTIDSKDGQLMIEDTKHGVFHLYPKTKTVFTSNDQNGFTVEFDIVADQVQSFRLSRGDRLRNLLFQKLNLREGSD